MNLSKILRSHTLVLIIIWGFVLRLLYILNTNHIFYPDEVYQVLEPAYRLIHGHGLIVWDFAHGLRSWLIPGIAGLPLLVSQSVGFNQPDQYHLIVQLMAVTLSLCVIPAGYYIVRNIHNNSVLALLAGFILATWYELIYFSPRFYSELLAIYLFSFAAWLMLQPRDSFLIRFGGGFFGFLGVLLRPQYGIILLPVGLYILWKRNILKPSVIAGSFVSLSLYGLVDWITIGYPLASLWNNYALSFRLGISEVFGTQSIEYYFQTVLATSLGIVLTIFLAWNYGKARYLWFSFIGLFLLHSLIPHKEYRFILILVPIWIMLSVIGIWEYSKNKVSIKSLVYGLIILSIIVSYGFISSNFTSHHVVYPMSLLSREPLILEANQLSLNDQVCGVYFPHRHWTTTPGHYYFNENIPIYTSDQPPPSQESVSHIITHIPLNEEEWKLVRVYDPNITQMPDAVYVYQKLDKCSPNPNYTIYRSFPEVESLIKKQLQ